MSAAWAPEGASRHELEVAGIRTVVHRAGQGDPVVFLHGAGTLGGFGWMAPLCERYEVIVPVHPGFGESEDDPSATTAHDYVLHYLDLLDALGIEHAHMVGHSLGGYIAATFAIEHSHRLRSLVLVCPAGLEVPSAPATDIFRVLPADLPGVLTRDSELLRRAAESATDTDAAVARYREMTTLAQLMWERSDDPRLARWLHRVSVPTLVLWGGDDQVLPPEQAKEWGALIPGSTVQVLAERGHLLLAESPEAAEAIAGFLAEQA